MKSIGRVTLLACWASSSCVSVQTGFVPSSELRPPARPESCALDVVLDGHPKQPHLVIGRISADSIAEGSFALRETQNDVLQRLKAKACTVGAHVIFAVTAATTRDSTTGSALVAVYVDEDGHPLSVPGASVAE